MLVGHSCSLRSNAYLLSLSVVRPAVFLFRPLACNPSLSQGFSPLVHAFSSPARHRSRCQGWCQHLRVWHAPPVRLVHHGHSWQRVSSLGSSSFVGDTLMFYSHPCSGRLNVLHNVLKKPLERLCAEFEGVHDDITVSGRQANTSIPNASPIISSKLQKGSLSQLLASNLESL